MSFVLDNSVALAWCFEDEQTPPLMALLDRVGPVRFLASLKSAGARLALQVQQFANALSRQIQQFVRGVSQRAHDHDERMAFFPVRGHAPRHVLDALRVRDA